MATEDREYISLKIDDGDGYRRINNPTSRGLSRVCPPPPPPLPSPPTSHYYPIPFHTSPLLHSGRPPITLTIITKKKDEMNLLYVYILINHFNYFRIGGVFPGLRNVRS